jgi:hypothetical protein
MNNAGCGIRILRLRRTIPLLRRLWLQVDEMPFRSTISYKLIDAGLARTTTYSVFTTVARYNSTETKNYQMRRLAGDRAVCPVGRAFALLFAHTITLLTIKKRN